MTLARPARHLRTACAASASVGTPTPANEGALPPPPSCSHRAYWFGAAHQHAASELIQTGVPVSERAQRGWGAGSA
jgi:hypothetical protein